MQAPPYVNLVAVLFACGPDQVAKTGEKYSLWTHHLLDELQQPHNSLFDMNQRIAERMRDQTPGFHYVHYNRCYSFVGYVPPADNYSTARSVAGSSTQATAAKQLLFRVWQHATHLSVPGT